MVTTRTRSYLRAHGVGIAALVAFGVGVMARDAHSHPLHTTLTEVAVADNGSVRIVLRAFVDDFAAAIANRAPVSVAATRTPTDSAATRYLATRLVLVDSDGRRVPLRVSDVRRTNELIWVTLTAPASRAGGVRLTNRVLFERFEDQVNIVQATVAGRRQTLLFTRREGTASKPLAP